MLYTRCPECHTTFRITEVILHKADGQVRCGRCAHVFNAYESLRDALKSADDDAAGAKGSTAAGEADGLDEASDAAVETSDSAATPDADSTVTQDRQDQLAGHALEELLQANPDLTGETPAPSTPAPSAPAAEGQNEEAGQAHPPEAAAEAAAKSEAKASENAAVESPGSSVRRADADKDGEDEVSIGIDQPDTEDDDADDKVTPRAARELRLPDWWRDLTDTHSPHRTWTIGAAILGAILFAQLAHHYRAGLARMPVMGSFVAAVYGAFGSDMSRRYDLAQYDIVDSAAVAQPGAGERGWLLIEARVRNNGPRVQPYPHIFLTLEDRWQKNIAGRYFAPDEYLISPRGDSSQMNVGEAVDAQFIIVDPGPQASGFEVDICMQLDDGFACAADMPLD
ncbi:MAG: DUF3426 domain-containing protein [Gammaproteobacteria bacterium]